MSAFGGKADMARGHREGLFIYLPTTNMCLGGGRHLSNFFCSNRRPWRHQGYGYVPDKSDDAKNKYWDCDDDGSDHNKSNENPIFHFTPLSTPIKLVLHVAVLGLTSALDELDTPFRNPRWRVGVASDQSRGQPGAYKIPHSHTRFCSTALDFGSELCSPRVTTFAECGGEKPSGDQLSLSRPTIWRPWSLLTSA